MNQKTILATLLLASVIGCKDAPPPKPKIETTPTVTVRNTDWYHNVFTVETDGGYIGSYHTCYYLTQVYVGLRAELTYHWDGWGQCYVLDSVQRKP